MDGSWYLAGSLLLQAGLLAAAFFVFASVASDYRTHGKLSRPIAVVQTGYFCVYALSSYIFLDSRLSHIRTGSILFPPAIAFMISGLLMVALSMPFLGRQSFGGEIKGLRTSGLYHYSRNPQLVGGFLFIVGYALLWPSWMGLLWASLWVVIAHLMVQCEEEHLENVYGGEFRAYRARTPRYLGRPRN
jgi:protein-S-isoprenylcysteine O-methyltransferase Ste14